MGKEGRCVISDLQSIIQQLRNYEVTLHLYDGRWSVHTQLYRRLIITDTCTHISWSCPYIIRSFLNFTADAITLSELSPLPLVHSQQVVSLRNAIRAVCPIAIGSLQNKLKKKFQQFAAFFYDFRKRWIVFFTYYVYEGFEVFARTHVDSFFVRGRVSKLETANRRKSAKVSASETSTIARGDHRRYLIELFEKFTRSVDLDLNL